MASAMGDCEVEVASPCPHSTEAPKKTPAASPKKGVARNFTAPKGLTKKRLPVDRPATSMANPKYSKTNLPLANAKPTPTTLPLAKKVNPSAPLVLSGTKKAMTFRKDQLPTIAERNKLKVFNLAREKLREMQSDFMSRCANLKEIKNLPVQGRYKFVTMVLNDNCKLVVSEDDLLRLPKNLPITSIGDFKERVRMCVESGLNVLYEHLKHVKMASSEVECRHAIEVTREALASDQSTKLEALLRQIDVLCKDVKNTDDSTELSTALNDLSDTRRSYKQLERKLLDIKKNTAEENLQLDNAHRAALEEAKQKREELEIQLTKQVNEYRNKSEKLSAALEEKEEIITAKSQEAKKLKKEINNLNTAIREINRRLDETEEELDSSNVMIKAKSDAIADMDTKLRDARAHIFKLQNIPVLQKFQFDDKDHIIVELQMQCSQLKARNKTLEATISRCESAQMEFSALKKEHDGMTEELQNLKTQLEGEDFGNRYHEAEFLKHQIMMAKQELESLKKEPEESSDGAETLH